MIVFHNEPAKFLKINNWLLRASMSWLQHTGEFLTSHSPSSGLGDFSSAHCCSSYLFFKLFINLKPLNSVIELRLELEHPALQFKGLEMKPGFKC